jgi:predicted ATPase
LIDQLFAHTKKTIDRDSNDILFRDKEGKKITPYRLSSGEKHMLIMLMTALVQDNKHAIMIMDEPEISLHTDWQEDLISNIRKINPNVQLIMATHSPSIVMNGWQDKIFEIDDLLTERRDRKDDNKLEI